MIRNARLRSALLPSIVVALLTPIGLMGACESEGTDTTPTGTAGSGATGTAGGGNTGLAGGGGSTTGTGGIGTGGTGTAGGGAGVTGGDGPCVVASCGNSTWQCGDCVDNDLDGHMDSYDPDCLGPCHNNEDGFSLDIPGADSTNKCFRDCYYDSNSGAGNDDCFWDLYCDPEEPQIELSCDYDPGKGDCPETQSQTCLDICMPLVPNGCDCFGCCELPAESGDFVYIGSENDGVEGPTCTLENVLDESLCHRCIPVEDCVNTCGHCELCLGKTELPPDCFPQDGGLPDGSVPDGGFPDGGTPQCPDGAQACGLPGQDPCPSGWYCITGCCRQIPT
jgi:hypothetical protein